MEGNHWKSDAHNEPPDGYKLQIEIEKMARTNLMASAPGTLGVFFCGAHVIASQMEAAVLKNMHVQALQALREGPGGPCTRSQRLRAHRRFRKENF